MTTPTFGSSNSSSGSGSNSHSRIMPGSVFTSGGYSADRELSPSTSLTSSNNSTTAPPFVSIDCSPNRKTTTSPTTSISSFTSNTANTAATSTRFNVGGNQMKRQKVEELLYAASSAKADLARAGIPYPVFDKKKEAIKAPSGNKHDQEDTTIKLSGVRLVTSREHTATSTKTNTTTTVNTSKPKTKSTTTMMKVETPATTPTSVSSSNTAHLSSGECSIYEYQQLVAASYNSYKVHFPSVPSPQSITSSNNTTAPSIVNAMTLPLTNNKHNSDSEKQNSNTTPTTTTSSSTSSVLNLVSSNQHSDQSTSSVSDDTDSNSSYCGDGVIQTNNINNGSNTSSLSTSFTIPPLLEDGNIRSDQRVAFAKDLSISYPSASTSNITNRLGLKDRYMNAITTSSLGLSSRPCHIITSPATTIIMGDMIQLSKQPRLVTTSIPPFIIIYANAAFFRMTKLSSNKVVGVPFEEILNGCDKSNKGEKGEEEQQEEQQEQQDFVTGGSSGGGDSGRRRRHHHHHHLSLAQCVVSSSNGKHEKFYFRAQQEDESSNNNNNSINNNGSNTKAIVCRSKVLPIVKQKNVTSSAAMRNVSHFGIEVVSVLKDGEENDDDDNNENLTSSIQSTNTRNDTTNRGSPTTTTTTTANLAVGVMG